MAVAASIAGFMSSRAGAASALASGAQPAAGNELTQLLASVGLDTGPNAAARSRLNDRSPEARASAQAL